MAQIDGSAQPKIAALEGIRGAAILLVFFVHYAVAWTLVFPNAANLGTVTGRVADFAFLVGNSGVDLFMALSGYLIYDHFMNRPQRLPVYMGRRVRRIFPAYLCVLAVYVALMLIDPARSKLGSDPLAIVTYVLECALLIPGFFGREPIVGIAWSLTYEILFYLLLPALVLGIGLRGRSQGLRVCVLLAVAALVLTCTWFVGFHERVVMFVGGMLAREVLVFVRYRFSRGKLVEAGALVLLVVAFVTMALLTASVPFRYPEFPNAFYRAVVILVAFSAVLAASLGADGLFRRVFEWGPLRSLGEVSYSFYLTHNLTMRIVMPVAIAVADPSAAGVSYWLFMPITFLVCLGPGLVLYALVERPISLRQPLRFRMTRPSIAASSSL